MKDDYSKLQLRFNYLVLKRAPIKDKEQTKIHPKCRPYRPKPHTNVQRGKDKDRGKEEDLGINRFRTRYKDDKDSM